MNPLETILRDTIRQTGPIPVSDFMAIALGHPEHGYYRKADPLGRVGDFITAPEISQVFGELIGLWAAVVWQQAGSPSPVRLVELGPGRGTLMADALRAAMGVPKFSSAVEVHLVETSPVLRDRQREALDGHTVTWHESPNLVPDGPAIFIANEFFDALPADQYVRTGDGWNERRIDFDESSGGFVFVLSEETAEPGTIPLDLDDAPVDSIFEHSPIRDATALRLAQRIAANGGAALVIDYGHFLSGLGDTLQAVRDHRPHDPLSDIGDADLTTHVDFAALSRAANGAGARTWGPVPQGAFLAALGAEQRAEALAAQATARQASTLVSGVRRLIAADGMGTLFKVMAITPAGAPAPPGLETVWRTEPGLRHE